VITKAMTAGKPIVILDTGALPEIVEQSKMGRLAPSGEFKAVAE